jgi:EAL domain-containing protein (putative c-di-GMP-specific phosphodiesterase class I)
MPYVQSEIIEIDRKQEAARLEALNTTGILDTPPEAVYDTVTRLAAEYFQADGAWLGFADESRVWFKSCWGVLLRELPREDSIFELVFATNGPVVVPDISKHPPSARRKQFYKRLHIAFFASVPVRSLDGKILGTLSIVSRQPREAMTPDALHMLDSLAGMITSLLELRRLNNSLMANSQPFSLFPSPSVRNITAAYAPIHWPSQADLRHALDERQFVLYYQPEIDLSSRKIVGLEALIRWVHPQRGLISPQDFIPLAEESGMILPIGDWGLAEACSQIQKWCLEDSRQLSLRVCVNLSARQFARVGLTDHIEALLLQYGLSSRQLGLEMTESSLISDTHTAMEVLGSLHKLGISLHMDDFGTGYSSLNQLHSYPFDVIKIDRSFVRRMTEGEQPLQIVRTIIELARVLGMDVVAEGIETRAQYCRLRKLGCRFGQGYFFARPMSAAAVTELLQLPGRVLLDAEFPEDFGDFGG